MQAFKEESREKLKIAENCQRWQKLLVMSRWRNNDCLTVAQFFKVNFKRIKELRRNSQAKECGSQWRCCWGNETNACCSWDTCLQHVKAYVLLFKNHALNFNATWIEMRQRSHSAGMETCLILYNQLWSRNLRKILSPSTACLFF